MNARLAMSINDEEIRKSLEILWEAMVRAYDLKLEVGKGIDAYPYNEYTNTLYKIGKMLKASGSIKQMLNNAADPNKISNGEPKKEIVEVDYSQISAAVEKEYQELCSNAENPKLVLSVF